MKELMNNIDMEKHMNDVGKCMNDIISCYTFKYENAIAIKHNNDYEQFDEFTQIDYYVLDVDYLNKDIFIIGYLHINFDMDIKSNGIEINISNKWNEILKDDINNDFQYIFYSAPEL